MVRSAAIRIQIAVCSEVGQVRAENEDAFGYSEKLGIAIVCDGMGGHADGRIASDLTASAVLDQLIDAAVDPPRSSAAALELLGATIRAANREVHEVGHRLQTSRPMGTTIVAVWFLHGKALIGHVGDSRCYRLRAGKLLRLTNDHSFLEETLGGDGQPIDPEFAARYPHILTRSIGQQPDCVPDLIDEVVMAGDRFLLCSDGLTGELDDEEIRTILAAASTAEDASAQLVAEANRCGGRDNVTVMVASVGDTESSPWQH